jgi:hypothetical protein
LKGCREVLHDGSNEIDAQMLTFMNRVDGRLKQIKTQVNQIDEAKSSRVRTFHLSFGTSVKTYFCCCSIFQGYLSNNFNFVNVLFL